MTNDLTQQMAQMQQQMAQMAQMAQMQQQMPQMGMQMPQMYGGMPEKQSNPFWYRENAGYLVGVTNAPSNPMFGIENIVLKPRTGNQPTTLLANGQLSLTAGLVTFQVFLSSKSGAPYISTHSTRNTNGTYYEHILLKPQAKAQILRFYEMWATTQSMPQQMQQQYAMPQMPMQPQYTMPQMPQMPQYTQSMAMPQMPVQQPAQVQPQADMLQMLMAQMAQMQQMAQMPQADNGALPQQEVQADQEEEVTETAVTPEGTPITVDDLPI